jgi:hypothetical protein
MVLNRFILGGVLFLHAAFRVPEFGLLYGSSSAAWSEPYRDFVRSMLAPQIPLPLLPVVSLLGELEPEPRQLLLLGLYAGLLATSLAFALGLRSRWAGGLALALHLLFHAIHPLADWSWVRLVAPFTIYCVLSRAGDYASLDARRRRRRGRGPPPPPPDGWVPAWPMRLLQIHVAAMYFHTGFARIDDPGWLQGDVLYEALAQTLFSRFDLDLYPWRPALALLSRAVFVLEPAAAVLLWVPRARTLCALALLGMHGVLELLTNVGWWNYIMLGGLLAFLPPAWLARLLPGVPPAPAALGRAAPRPPDSPGGPEPVDWESLEKR